MIEHALSSFAYPIYIYSPLLRDDDSVVPHYSGKVASWFDDWNRIQYDEGSNVLRSTQFHSSAWGVATVAVARTSGALVESCLTLRAPSHSNFNSLYIAPPAQLLRWSRLFVAVSHVRWLFNVKTSPPLTSVHPTTERNGRTWGLCTRLQNRV